jgi:hypothetical protein
VRYRRPRQIAGFSLLLGILLGCGSEKEEKGWVISGNYAGTTFRSSSGGFDGLPVDITMTILEFANAPNLCELPLGSGSLPSYLLILTVFICTQDADPVGDYTIVPGTTRGCSRGEAFARFDALSGPGVPQDGVGTVTITSGTRPSEATSQPMGGSVGVVFGDGSAFAGTFSVPYCSSLVQ